MCLFLNNLSRQNINYQHLKIKAVNNAYNINCDSKEFNINIEIDRGVSFTKNSIYSFDPAGVIKNDYTSSSLLCDTLIANGNRNQNQGEVTYSLVDESSQIINPIEHNIGFNEQTGVLTLTRNTNYYLNHIHVKVPVLTTGEAENSLAFNIIINRHSSLNLNDQVVNLFSSRITYGLFGDVTGNTKQTPDLTANIRFEVNTAVPASELKFELWQGENKLSPTNGYEFNPANGVLTLHKDQKLNLSDIWIKGIYIPSPNITIATNRIPIFINPHGLYVWQSNIHFSNITEFVANTSNLKSSNYLVYQDGTNVENEADFNSTNFELWINNENVTNSSEEKYNINFNSTNGSISLKENTNYTIDNIQIKVVNQQVSLTPLETNVFGIYIGEQPAKESNIGLIIGLIFGTITLVGIGNYFGYRYYKNHKSK
ncbi:MAG: hypothetical protein B1217_0585 [Candidatus Malacoplasma girerdii]|nr:MAG: hypothetical protein B1217_0585 [Candidatus Malacoplasma girerdii]